MTGDYLFKPQIQFLSKWKTKYKLWPLTIFTNPAQFPYKYNFYTNNKTHTNTNYHLHKVLCNGNYILKNIARFCSQKSIIVWFVVFCIFCEKILWNIFPGKQLHCENVKCINGAFNRTKTVEKMNHLKTKCTQKLWYTAGTIIITIAKSLSATGKWHWRSGRKAAWLRSLSWFFLGLSRFFVFGIWWIWYLGSGRVNCQISVSRFVTIMSFQNYKEDGHHLWRLKHYSKVVRADLRFLSFSIHTEFTITHRQEEERKLTDCHLRYHRGNDIFKFFHFLKQPLWCYNQQEWNVSRSTSKRQYNINGWQPNFHTCFNFWWKSKTKWSVLWCLRL